MLSQIRKVEVGEKWWASIYYVEPRGFAEKLDETCVRERGIGVMPSFGAQTTGKMQLSFTEIRNSVGRRRFGGKIKSSVLDPLFKMPINI